MSSTKINADQWTLFDKVMYGGLGYGAFCLPTDFFKVIIAIIFPPLGEVINIVEDTVSTSFPYINWKSIKKLFSYTSLNTIVYSFLLTTLFYFPGLVYTLTNIVNKERNISYDKKGNIISIDKDENDYSDIDIIEQKIIDAGLTVGKEMKKVGLDVKDGGVIVGKELKNAGLTIGEGTKDVGIFIKDMGIDIGKSFEHLGSLW